MMNDTRIKAERIVDAAGREAALAVLGATYRNEKGWIADPAQQFPADDLTSNGIDWFIVCFNEASQGFLLILLYGTSWRFFKTWYLLFRNPKALWSSK